MLAWLEWSQQGGEWPRIGSERQAVRDQTVKDLKGQNKELGFSYNVVQSHSRVLS